MVLHPTPPHASGWNFPWLADPFKADNSGGSRWKKIKGLGNTRCGGKVVLVRNQSLQDGLELPATFVVKQVQKAQLQGLDAQRWQERVRSALALSANHRELPHVVTYYGAWQDDVFVYVAMAHCAEGELFVAATCGNLYQTDEARRDVAKQMLTAVGSLHSHGLTHPDLRLHHFLLSSSRVKVVGLMPTGMLPGPSAVAGFTNGAVAAKQHDVFQLGAALFTIFSGGIRPPLSIQPPPPGAQVESAKDFLSRLMHPDHHLRSSIACALAHPWLRGCTPLPTVLSCKRRSPAGFELNEHALIASADCEYPATESAKFESRVESAL